MFKVVVLDHSFKNLDIEREILEPLGAELFEYQCSDPKQAAVLAEDADAVLVTNFATLTAETLGKLKKCKVIVKHGIGMDIVDVAAASKLGIKVANLPDYCRNEVAEHAVSLMLAIGRKIPEADRRTRELLDHNIVDLMPIKPFYQSRVCIFGFGRIGRITAGLLSSMMGDIVFCDPFLHDDVCLAGKTIKKIEFQEACSTSDFLIIHAPYTKDNYHMFDEKAFNSMSRNPCIVNVGRGELIDGSALAKALDTGMVSAAALDVVEGMPPIKPDDPLMHCKNLYLTPHCAWYSEESYRRIQADAANEVKRVINGEPLRSWYNKELMSEYHENQAGIEIKKPVNAQGSR